MDTSLLKSKSQGCKILRLKINLILLMIKSLNMNLNLKY